MSHVPIHDKRTRALQVLSALFGATWRYAPTSPEMRTRAKSPPCVYAFWHEHLLPVLHFHRNLDIQVIVSPSRDGRRLATVLKKWGYGIIWGSSTREGNNALVESVNSLRAGTSVMITPDGPQGPRQQAKRGAALISFRAGVPVVAVAARSRPAVTLHTWDHFVIPLPFSRIDILYSEAIPPPVPGEENVLIPGHIERIQKALDT